MEKLISDNLISSCSLICPVALLRKIYLLKCTIPEVMIKYSQSIMFLKSINRYRKNTTLMELHVHYYLCECKELTILVYSIFFAFTCSQLFIYRNKRNYIYFKQSVGTSLGFYRFFLLFLIIIGSKWVKCNEMWVINMDGD